MHWHEFITGAYKRQKHGPGIASKPVFHPPALVQDVADLEAQLNVRLSASLRSLLLETNGVMDMLAIDGGDWFENMWLLWPISEIINANLLPQTGGARSTHDSNLDDLLFFAGAGCDGILFGHPITDGRMAAPEVRVWYPLRDEAPVVAPSLKEFIQGWESGEITV